MTIHHLASKEAAAEAFSRLIMEYASLHEVLLLLPGGSAAPVGILALRTLSPEVLAKITVSLTDERYGSVGFADSNWQLLQTIGLPPQVVLLPVLTGLDAAQTTKNWANVLMAQAARKKVIALFGIGTDFHIAGIKVGAEMPKNEAAALYQASDFERITITPAFIAQLNLAVVYAEGHEKEEAVEKLVQGGDALKEPMQLIHDSLNSVVYYYK